MYFSYEPPSFYGWIRHTHITIILLYIIYTIISAIGCPVLTPPRDGWIEQVGQDILVGCNTTREKWYLRCNGKNWIGQMRNCSALGMVGEGEYVHGNKIHFVHGACHIARNHRTHHAAGNWKLFYLVQATCGRKCVNGGQSYQSNVG